MTGVVVIGVTAVVGFVGAATTISTAITTAGNITTTAGTLNINGLSTLSGGATTTTLVVGSGSASTVSGMVLGFCTAASVNVAATSSAMLTCNSATGITSGDRIFVQATSSLPSNFVITAASSTSAGVIQIRVLNTATSTPSYAADTGINSFNFWAVR